MRKIALALMVLGLATPAWTEQSLGSAQAHSIDGSGVKADILFLDGGDSDSGLVVSGFATGLDPNQAYITLVYDSGSVPGGSAACSPTGPFLNGQQMMVGAWSVGPDGTGTLFVVKTGDAYAPLGEVGSVSVRQAPFALQACGRVHQQP